MIPYSILWKIKHVPKPNHQPNEKTHDDVDDLIHSPLDIPMHRPKPPMVELCQAIPAYQKQSATELSIGRNPRQRKYEEQKQNIEFSK